MTEKQEFIKYIKSKFPLDMNTMKVNGKCISELKSEESRGIIIGFPQKEREIIIHHIWSKIVPGYSQLKKEGIL